MRVLLNEKNGCVTFADLIASSASNFIQFTIIFPWQFQNVAHSSSQYTCEHWLKQVRYFASLTVKTSVDRNRALTLDKMSHIFTFSRFRIIT